MISPSRLAVLCFLLSGLFSGPGLTTAGAFDLGKAESGVFRIENIGLKGQESSGTGFLVNDTGLIVTNAHVVDDARTLLVVQRQPTIIKVWSARVVSVSGARDLALLQVDGVTGTPMVLNPSGPTKGSDVYAVGFPGQADEPGEWEAFDGALRGTHFHDVPISDQYDNFVRSSIKKGNVEDIRPRAWGFPKPQGKLLAVQHSAPISGGNSGGPLIDNEDRVVGVNTRLLGEGFTRDAAGHGVIIGNILRFSSSSTELIALLDSLHLPYNTQQAGPTSTPTPIPSPTVAPTPTPAPSLAPPVRDAPAESRTPAAGLAAKEDTKPDEGNHHLVLWIAGILLAAAVAGGVILVVLLRKGSRPAAPPPFVPRPVPPPSQPPPSPSPPPLPGARGPVQPPLSWLLSGEDTKGRPYRVVFDPGAFARHQGTLRVGRSATQAELRIDHDSLSRVHAELRCRKNQLYLVDKGSSNGTKVNGRPLGSESDEAGIRPGDVLHLGEVTLVLGLDHAD